MRSLKKGFTLIELIIVITILAVLATVAFITLGDYPVQSRDSKRESDIANIAKKATVITADGTVSYKDLVLGQGSAAATATTAGTYKVYSGDINYAKLKESADAFKAPLAGEKYQITVINDAQDNFVCFEVAAKREKAKDANSNLVTTRGTCNISGTDLDSHLYAKSKPANTLRAN